MKSFDISIGQSVGDISLGVTRQEVRSLLGDYREFENSFKEKILSFDQFDFCNVGYNSDNKVEFVCFHTLNNIELTLRERTISNMTSLELFAYINSLDKTVELEEGGVGFESNKLGIAAYFEKTPVTILSTGEEILCEKLESITVAIPNYWKKYRV